jgi:hypothetical protein
MKVIRKSSRSWENWWGRSRCDGRVPRRVISNGEVHEGLGGKRGSS